MKKTVTVIEEWHRIDDVVIERTNILKKHGKSKPITPWRIVGMARHDEPKKEE
jgi:hypothetical protein